MENPIKMDDLGGPTPIFGNPHLLLCFVCLFCLSFFSSFVLLKVRQIRHEDKHLAYDLTITFSTNNQGMFVSPIGGGKFDDVPLMPGSVWFRLLACTTAIFFLASWLRVLSHSGCYMWTTCLMVEKSGYITS